MAEKQDLRLWVLLSFNVFTMKDEKTQEDVAMEKLTFFDAENERVETTYFRAGGAKQIGFHEDMLPDFSDLPHVQVSLGGTRLGSKVKLTSMKLV